MRSGAGMKGGLCMNTEDTTGSSGESDTTVHLAAPEPRPSNSTWPQPNLTLAGRFRFEKPIKKGANGEVWQAMNLRLDMRFAIKIPNMHKTTPHDLERFRREARALCLIHNEHVLRFFEFDTEPTPYLVMELLRGHDLAEHIERHGPFSLSETKKICRQICTGLQAIHGAGIVHRDIKPANIYCLSGTEKLKIIDFGLMKLIHDSGRTAEEYGWNSMNELTEVGTLLGTPAYMSPEQWSEQAIVFQSDLWSVAVVLYRLVTGVLPFTAKTQYALMRMVIKESAQAASTIRSDLPPEINAFFYQALHKDPSKRFSSAMELCEAFEAIPDGQPIAGGSLRDTVSTTDPQAIPTPPSSFSTQTTARIIQSRNSRRFLWMAAGAAGFLALAAGSITGAVRIARSLPAGSNPAPINRISLASPPMPKLNHTAACHEVICNGAWETMSHAALGAEVLAADPGPDGNLYWSNPHEHTVHAIRKTGGSPEMLWNKGEVRNIFVGDRYIFWTESDSGNVVRQSKKSGKPGYLVKFNCDYACAPAGLAGWGDRIYWTWLDTELDEKPLTILQNVREAPELFSEQETRIARYALAADAEHVYWASSNGSNMAVWKMAIGKPYHHQKIHDLSGPVSELAIDPAEGFIYWLEDKSESGSGKNAIIARKSISNPEPDAQILVTSEFQLRNLIVSEGSIYWSTQGGHIHKMPKNGSGPAITLVLEKETNTVLFTLDEQNIFWVNPTTGELKKARI